MVLGALSLRFRRLQTSFAFWSYDIADGCFLKAWKGGSLPSDTIL